MSEKIIPEVLKKAILTDNKRVCWQIIEKGIKVGQVIYEDNNTPLHLAIYKNNSEISELLIEKGDINIDV